MVGYNVSMCHHWRKYYQHVIRLCLLMQKMRCWMKLKKSH